MKTTCCYFKIHILRDLLAFQLDILTMAQLCIPVRTNVCIIPIVGGQLLSPLHPPYGLDPHGSVAKDWVVVLAVHAVGLPAVVDLVPQGGLVILVCCSIRQDI